MAATPEALAELERRRADCPEGFPLFKWAQMTRAERRAFKKGAGRARK